ncbi:MAG: hypothetical protein AABZ46_00275 [Nitrospirota bacterium]
MCGPGLAKPTFPTVQDVLGCPVDRNNTPAYNLFISQTPIFEKGTAMKRIFFLAVCSLLVLAPQAFASVWVTSQLTDDVLWDGAPDVSGSNIVWQHDDGND